MNPTGVSTTDASTSTAGSESTAADTVLDTTDGPPVMFCEEMSGPSTIACTDFDAENKDGWEPYPASGFTRMVTDDPPAHSEPNFVRLVRTNDVDQAQALYGVDFSPQSGGVVAMSLRVRYPPNLVKLCGAQPLRLLEIRYGVPGSFTNVVVEASPEEVVVYLFSPETNYEVDRFELGPPGRDAWSRMQLALDFGDNTGDATLSIQGNLAQPNLMAIPQFNPGDLLMSVNVGPWFETRMAPPDGCLYDLDDLLIELLP